MPCAVEEAPIVTTGRENSSQSALRQMQSPIFISPFIRGLSMSKMRFTCFPPRSAAWFLNDRQALVYWRRDVNCTALFSAKNWMVLPLTP